MESEGGLIGSRGNEIKKWRHYIMMFSSKLPVKRTEVWSSCGNHENMYLRIIRHKQWGRCGIYLPILISHSLGVILGHISYHRVSIKSENIILFIVYISRLYRHLGQFLPSYSVKCNVMLSWWQTTITTDMCFFFNNVLKSYPCWYMQM